MPNDIEIRWKNNKKGRTFFYHFDGTSYFLEKKLESSCFKYYKIISFADDCLLLS
jgi:hypothetical protein